MKNRMAGLILETVLNNTVPKSAAIGSGDFVRFLPHQTTNQTTTLFDGNDNAATASNRLPGGTVTSHHPDDQLDKLIEAALSIEMGQYERLFWILLFSIMVLIAAGGNTIVVYIVSTNKEMKSVTNYFLVNLSLADTMVSTLNVIFNFISMLNSHWPFGKIYCKISNFIAILSISASVFTLTAISCDRYNAIIHPLRPRMSHRHAIGWILLIWTLSSALAMPNAIYSSLVEDRLANENVAVTCTMIWPDGRYPLSSYDHIYNIVILVVTYLVPILTMAVLYYKVGKELWGYEAIGENIDKQARAIMAKKKIVKMMIVVVIIFALCWLPYHAFFVINFYVPEILQDTPLHYQRCYLIMYWLAMSNSMYNPIIIYFMNSNFRQEFKKILCFLCCCHKYKPPTRHQNSNTNNISRPYSQTTTSQLERGRDRTNLRRQTTDDAIDLPIEQSQAQKKDNATDITDAKHLAANCNDKSHVISETCKQSVICSIEEEEEEGEEVEPFLSKMSNPGLASDKKLIDFTNKVASGNTKDLTNDKVWI